MLKAFEDGNSQLGIRRYSYAIADYPILLLERPGTVNQLMQMNYSPRAKRTDWIKMDHFSPNFEERDYRYKYVLQLSEWFRIRNIDFIMGTKQEEVKISMETWNNFVVLLKQDDPIRVYCRWNETALKQSAEEFPQIKYSLMEDIAKRFYQECTTPRLVMRSEYTIFGILQRAREKYVEKYSFPAFKEFVIWKQKMLQICIDLYTSKSDKKYRDVIERLEVLKELYGFLIVTKEEKALAQCVVQFTKYEEKFFGVLKESYNLSYDKFIELRNERRREGPITQAEIDIVDEIENEGLSWDYEIAKHELERAEREYEESQR